MNDNSLISSVLVEAICDFLLKHGRDHEGIFRVSPNQNQLKAVRARLALEGHQFYIAELKKTSDLDPYLVAALLKQIMGDMEEPVLASLAGAVVDSRPENYDFGNSEDTILISDICRSIAKLAQERKKIATSVLDMLHRFSLCSKVTLMGSGQLATMFAPALFGCPDSLSGLSRLNRVTQLLNLLISQNITGKPVDALPTDQSNSESDAIWLTIVRGVVREKLFAMSSEQSDGIMPAPTKLSSAPTLQFSEPLHNKTPSEPTSQKININIDLANNFIKHSGDDIIPTKESASLPFIQNSQTMPSSSRSLQLARIVGVLCERFGLHGSSNKKQSTISALDEKIALQRALLHLEGNFGRPVDKAERQIVRPLYERYRELKRLTATTNNHHNSANPHRQAGQHHHSRHVRPHSGLFDEKPAINVTSSLDVGADLRWASPANANSKYSINYGPELADFDPTLLSSNSNAKQISTRSDYPKQSRRRLQSSDHYDGSSVDSEYRGDKPSATSIALNSTSG